MNQATFIYFGYTRVDFPKTAELLPNETLDELIHRVVRSLGVDPAMFLGENLVMKAGVRMEPGMEVLPGDRIHIFPTNTLG